MLSFRNGKLCLLVTNQHGDGHQSIALDVGEYMGGDNEESDIRRNRLKQAIEAYSGPSNDHSFKNISEIKIPLQTLNNYPTVKKVWQVRELFVKIFDLLGFIILRSDDTFPEMVLLFKDIPYNTTFEVRASGFVEKSEFKDACDLLICWENDLDHEPENFEILAIAQFYDYYAA